jgi:hypothetical protein
MDRSTTMALVAMMCVLFAPAAAAQTTLTPDAVFMGGGVLTDGLAVGDVHPNPGDEVVVVAEGTTWNTNPPNPGTGRAYVLSADLNLLTTFQPSEANRELMGLPLIEQLDSGPLEYLVGEFRSAALGGRLYALGGTDADELAADWVLSPRA